MHTTRLARAFHLIAFKLTRCLFDVIELNMNFALMLRCGTHVAAKRIHYHMAWPVTHFPRNGATEQGRRLAPPSTYRKHVEEMLMEKI